jgi:hypothetical protein
MGLAKWEAHENEKLNPHVNSSTLYGLEMYLKKENWGLQKLTTYKCFSKTASLFFLLLVVIPALEIGARFLTKIQKGGRISRFGNNLIAT